MLHSVRKEDELHTTKLTKTQRKNRARSKRRQLLRDNQPSSLIPTFDNTDAQIKNDTVYVSPFISSCTFT